MIEFKALSALLSYPTPELRQVLPEIGEAISTSSLLAARERKPLLHLVEELTAGDLLDAEARYVELFDRGRATSLNLFEHLHGESRDRGQAMVELKQHYERAGFDLTSCELPDYLPVVLEYLSCRDLREAREMLGDCSHILRRIGETLFARQSSYSAIIQALLAIAGESPIQATAIRRDPQPPEDLDRDWAEPPAFGQDPLRAAPVAGQLGSRPLADRPNRQPE